MGRKKKSRPNAPAPFSRDAARKQALHEILTLLEHRNPGIRSGRLSSHDISHWLGVGWDIANKLVTDDGYDPPLSTLLQVAHALDLRSIEELLGPMPLSSVLRVGRTATVRNS